MNNAADNGEDFGTALAFMGLFPLFVLLFVWLISAIVAATVAVDRDRSGIGWFLATFFFLGPLGVGFALIAQRGEMDRLPDAERRKVAEGRQRFTCPRCSADNDLPNAATSYDCWRCEEHRKVKANATADKKG